MRILCLIIYLNSISLMANICVLKAQQTDTTDTQILSTSESSFNTYFAGLDYIVSGKSIRFIGKTQSASFRLYRLYGGKNIFRHPKSLFSIYYTVSANFFSKLNYNVRDTGKRKKRYGLGISPAGYTFMIPVTKYFSVNAGFTGGFSFFNKSFPDKNGTPLNFTYSLNSALLFQIYKQFRLTLRAKYYHHSNAEIGKVNPGLDLIMLSAGFQAQF